MPPDRLPSKPKLNPGEQCNAIMLRSGTQLEGPKSATVKVEGQKEYDKGVAPLPKENEPKEHTKSEILKEPRPFSPKPYIGHLPFPQRFAKAKLDSQFSKFPNMLKKLHVNVPFIDALSQMPLHAKFLKQILSKKGKIDEHKTIALA